MGGLYILCARVLQQHPLRGFAHRERLQCSNQVSLWNIGFTLNFLRNGFIHCTDNREASNATNRTKRKVIDGERRSRTDLVR